MRLGIRRGNLRSKIIAWFFIPTAIILFSIALINFYTYQSVTENLVFERDQALTHLAAGQLALQLSQEPDLLLWVQAWEVYKHNPNYQRFLFDRVSDVLRLRIGESGSAYLVDEKGRVIYHSTPRYIGQSFAAQPAVQQVMSGKEGAIRTRDLDGQDIVASFAPVSGTPWGVINQEDWATVSSAGQWYGQFLVFMLALGLLIPAFVVAVGVRRITSPIAKLVSAAQQIAAGRFEQRIAVRTRDELEELAEQFNSMAIRLQESYAHLEHRVADRTKELEALNAIAASANEAQDLDTILNRILDRIMPLLDLEVGEIRLWSEEGNRLVVRTQRGLSPEYVQATDQCEVEDTLAGLVAHGGEPWTEADVQASPRSALVREEGLRAIAVFPLRAKEKVLGTLSLATRRGWRPFTADERRLLRAVGDQVGLVVENARLSEEALQRAVVEERGRLARELHDSVTQGLYGVTLYAEAAGRVLAVGEAGLAAEYLHQLRETAQEALREMRLLIFELRPPVLQRGGLVAALQARLEAVEGRGGLETELSVEGDGQLSTESAEGLYRIAQEALNNALRHSHAHHITVGLCLTPSLTVLKIIDDGVGFDPATARDHGGLGLYGMEERAARIGGRLTVESKPGAGTCINVEVCP